MSDVKGSRREKADATRRKIIQAAHAEFVEKGFNGATIASIAKRAGVAVQTVYFVFHTKQQLMTGVIDTAVLGEEEPTVPEESEWWAAALAEPDATESLRIWIRGSGPIFSRASVISAILWAASLDDPEVRRTYEHHEELREVAFRRFVEVLKKKGRLRKGLTVASATDLLLTIYGDMTYHAMTVERGWSHERFIDWLCDALPSILLEVR